MSNGTVQSFSFDALIKATEYKNDNNLLLSSMDAFFLVFFGAWVGTRQRLWEGGEYWFLLSITIVAILALYLILIDIRDEIVYKAYKESSERSENSLRNVLYIIGLFLIVVAIISWAISGENFLAMIIIIVIWVLASLSFALFFRRKVKKLSKGRNIV